MVLSREELFESIKKRLEILAFSISNSGSLNFNNSAVQAENFFRDLLNRIYGWQLKNANFDSQNTADIDLADPDQNICIQVTARNDREKIADTLKSFHGNEKNAGGRLKFMLISKEALKYKAFTGYEDKFDIAGDILDVKKLLKKINDLSTSDLEEIDAFLKKEIKLEGEQALGGSANATATVGNIIIQNIIGDKEKDNGPKPVVVSSTEFYPASFIPDLKYFVGRGELLANLSSTLQAHHKASIHDISGLGKTFACYKFAEDNKENYSTIFFVNSAKEAMMESLARLGQMMHPGIEDAPQEQQALAFKNWLETNGNWLAIYDNVDEPAALKPFVPNNNGGDCLFTSNTDEVTELGRNVAIFKLPLTESGKLLYKRVKGDDREEAEFSDEKEREAFEKIVESTDGLPIALVTTGAFIKESRIGFQEFWEVFENADEIILSSEDKFDGYEKGSALKAFSIALDKISGAGREEPSVEEKAVREMLNAASLVFPDSIPEELFQQLLENNLEGFKIGDKRQWVVIRNRFSNFDLFKYDSGTKSFSTHRLIQKCIQSRLGHAKIPYCEKVLNLLTNFFPLYDYSNKTECEQYYQHTVAALENADKASFETEVSILSYNRVARYQHLLGSYDQAVEFCQRNLEISRNLFGEEAEETAITLNSLAFSYEAQGKYDDAIELFKRAIEISEKSVSKDDTLYATRLNNLADVYRSQGKNDDALELFKRAIEIGEKTIGKEHPEYAVRLNNLGTVYKNQGKYDEAIELYKQAMEITGKALGKEHPAYATRLNNLASVYDNQGKYDEAIELYKQAMEIDEKIYGKDHPDYATDLNNLAVTYFKMGEFSKALSLFEEALRILEAKLPPEHPHSVITKESIEICKTMLDREGSEESSESL